MFEAGHPYKDVVEDVEQVRFHCSEDIHDWAQITAHETMIDGVVTHGAPYINVYADAEELTGEQAGEVIEALRVARIRLDEINAGSQRCTPWRGSGPTALRPCSDRSGSSNQRGTSPTASDRTRTSSNFANRSWR